jgi:hypothetical protein
MRNGSGMYNKDLEDELCRDVPLMAILQGGILHTIRKQTDLIFTITG